MDLPGKYEPMTVADINFHDHFKLIISTVNKLSPMTPFNSRRYEELLEVACEAFSDANSSWDPGVSCFSTWVCSKIEYAIRSYNRTQQRLKRNPLANDLQIDLDSFSRSYSTFDYEVFLERLNDDAKLVVKCVFDPPFQVQVYLQKKLLTPKRIKMAVKRYLIEDLEWSKIRVLAAFVEITTALKE